MNAGSTTTDLVEDGAHAVSANVVNTDDATIESILDEIEDDVKKEIPPCYYHDYLKLDKILDANYPRSIEFSGKMVHDEHLFITIHQSYELWFKQIIFELDSIIKLFQTDSWQLNNKKSNLLTIQLRFERINSIMTILVQQMEILRTLSPLNFLVLFDIYYN